MLTISKNTDCSRIILKSSLITTLFNLPDTYTKFTVTIYYNCCDCTNYQFEVTRTPPADFNVTLANTYSYNAVDDQLELNPALVALTNTKWEDGIYKIVITASNDSGDRISSEGNCYFLDCSTSCKVAKQVKRLLKDKPDITLTMLHFGLVNGSNCNCNCDELCYLYKKLIGLLDNTTTTCCK